MHNKTLTKLVLDIVLTILFIMLIYPRETGFTFHEIAGLSIGGLFTFHIMLNWPWVKNVTKNLLNPRIKRKTKLFYVLNSLSVIAVSTIIITGIQISEVLFPVQGMVSHTTVLVHKWTAYSCLVLFGLHIALHWRFFAHTVPRMLRTPGRPAWSKIALRVGAIVLILGLLYSQVAASSDSNRQQLAARQEYQSTGNTANENRPKPKHDRMSPGSSESIGSGQSNTDISISDDTDNSNTPSISSGSSNNSDDTSITLAEFLGKMFCTGCEKHCSLLNPRCDRGIPQQEAAKQEYQAIYSSTSQQ